MQTISEIWEAVHSSRQWGGFPESDLLLSLSEIKFPKPIEQVKVLDLGCGNGASMWPMLVNGMQVTGIDISSSAIEHTRVFLGSRSYPNVSLDVGDIRKLPYPDASFDLVTDICTIQHQPVSDLPGIFAEVARVLCPSAGFITRYMSMFSWVPPNSQRLTLLTHEELRDLLSVNFEIIYFEQSARTFANQYVHYQHHIVTAQKRA